LLQDQTTIDFHPSSMYEDISGAQNRYQRFKDIRGRFWNYLKIIHKM